MKNRFILIILVIVFLGIVGGVSYLEGMNHQAALDKISIKTKRAPVIVVPNSPNQEAHSTIIYGKVTMADQGKGWFKLHTLDNKDKVININSGTFINGQTGWGNGKANPLLINETKVTVMASNETSDSADAIMISVSSPLPAK